LGKVGGRTGRLIGRVQSIIPPTIYYSKVGLELGRLVFQQRKMSPPDLATFQNHLQPFLTRLVKNPTSIFSRAAEAGSSAAAQPVNVLNRIRNLNAQQWASAGVVAAEVIGFFSVGEMIGRFKVVGYRSNSPATH
jgi:F-type H+-transporting ATPase subunit g